MKALVTGGTGYIGSPVVDLLLERGHHVRLFSRASELPVRLAGKDVSLVSGDLRYPESLSRAMKGMDVFYRCNSEISSLFRDVETCAVGDLVCGDLTHEKHKGYWTLDCAQPQRMCFSRSMPRDLVRSSVVSTLQRTG
jgi:hypothetical protein